MELLRIAGAQQGLRGKVARLAGLSRFTSEPPGALGSPLWTCVLLGSAPVPPTPKCPCLGLQTNIAPPQAGNLQTSQTRDSSSRLYVVILPLFGKLLIILQSLPHYHLLFSAKDCVGVL